MIPRVQSHVSRSPSHSLAVLVALAGSLAAFGCRTGPAPFLPKLATDARSAELEVRQAAEAGRAAAEKAAEEKIAETEKRKEEFEKESQKIQARLARREKRLEAVGLVRAGQYREALDIIEDVFVENEKSIAVEREEAEEAAREEAAEAAGTPATEAEADGAARAESAKPADEAAVAAPGTAGTEEEEKEEEAVLPHPMTDAEKVSFLVVEASAHFGLKDAEATIATYEEALELDPYAQLALQNLGSVLFGEQRYSEAIDAWQRYFATGVRDGRTLYLYAQALYEVGKATSDPGLVDAARVVMRSVLVERPADRTVKLWLASLEYESGRFEEAAHYYEALLAEEPLSREYLELLANCCIMTKDYEKAIDTLEVSLRIGEPDRDQLRSLGDLYAYQGFPLKAAALYARAYGDDPSKASSKECFQTGVLFLEADDLVAAERWLGAIEASDDDYYDAQAQLAQVHRGLGDLDAAIEAFEKMRSAKPTSGAAHLAAAHIYFERGELDEAQRAYTSATGVRETKAEGLAGLAEVAYARKDLAHAISLYEEAAAAAPDEGRFRGALQEIRAEKESIDHLETRHPTTAKSGD